MYSIKLKNKLLLRSSFIFDYRGVFRLQTISYKYTRNRKTVAFFRIFRKTTYSNTKNVFPYLISERFTRPIISSIRVQRSRRNNNTNLRGARRLDVIHVIGYIICTIRRDERKSTHVHRCSWTVSRIVEFFAPLDFESIRIRFFLKLRTKRTEYKPHTRFSVPQGTCFEWNERETNFFKRVYLLDDGERVVVVVVAVTVTGSLFFEPPTSSVRTISVLNANRGPCHLLITDVLAGKHVKR